MNELLYETPYKDSSTRVCGCACVLQKCLEVSPNQIYCWLHEEHLIFRNLGKVIFFKNIVYDKNILKKKIVYDDNGYYYLIIIISNNNNKQHLFKTSLLLSVF